MRFTIVLSFLFLFLLPLSGQELPAHELDHRIGLSVDRLLDLDRQPAFTHDFLLADVRLDAADPRRFDNFSGDLSGRYLEVVSLLPEARHREARLPELVTGILGHQQADGRFGDPSLAFTAAEIGGEHMALLWGNGRLLVGLMAYYRQSRDPATLAAARKLGDFFITTAAACRKPAVVQLLEGYGAKGIICFTQYIEGLVPLAEATGDQRYVRAARDAYTILPPRGKQHSHGYLSTLRGVLLLHELTGDASLLDYVKTTFDDLLASPDYTVYGAVFEYFGGLSDPKNDGNRDEGCSSADFVRLALHLHALTGDDRYLRVGEKGLLNALYYNQCGNGDFGHHYFSHGVMKASNPRRAWWCCTMHGLRALLAVRDHHAVTTVADGRSLDLLTTQTYADPEHAFAVTGATAGAGREQFRITVERWPAGDKLYLPRPAWGTDWTLRKNGKVVANAAGKAKRITVSPRAGDELILEGTPTVAFHASGEREAAAALPATPRHGYLTYGPYLLGIRQESFVAEPDWANQVRLADLAPAPAPGALSATFRHSGYPGLNPVRLVPMAWQPYAGHPYLRVYTHYGREIAPKSPDR